MAGSSIVGVLKVLLTADTAQYSTGLDQASKKTTQFNGEMSGFATNVSGLGKALAGMVTVGAIAGAASAVADYAGKVVDLSAATGLTTRTIQEMDHAAAMTGKSLENFTNAAFKLGTNIAGGSNSVVGALEKLGFSYDAIRRMSPDEQWNAVTRALSGVENAQDRNRLAVELFGKSAKEILPAIAQGYDKIAASAVVAGDDSLKAIDMASDALDGFLHNAKMLGVELAGGLVIAVKEAGRQFENWVGIIGSVNKGLETWGILIDTAKGKTSELPKILNEATIHAKNLPKPLADITMSLTDIHKAEAELDKKVKARIDSTKAAQKATDDQTKAHERFADSVKRLDTAEFFVRLKDSVQEASFELEELPATFGIAAAGFEPFKAAVEESSLQVDGWGAHLKTTMEGLPTVILNAIQGGGSAIGAAGSFIGTSLMEKFQEKFGPAIKAALPFGIGEAVTALLPTLGALFGPVAEKIAGFFKSIFGGPSAEELRGRKAVADFEGQLQSLLSQTQKNDAGNESWKMTVIAIRDAYIAAGLSEADALAAAERLWKSSKIGGGETEKVIGEILEVLKKSGGQAAELAANLDKAYKDRSFTTTETRNTYENVYRKYEDGEGGDDPGHALGTMGRYGSWFKAFPTTGFSTTLHGMEAVITPQQAPAFAMDVLGGMQPATAGGGAGMGELLHEMRSLRRELVTIIPAMSESAARHGSQTSGRRR